MERDSPCSKGTASEPSPQTSGSQARPDKCLSTCPNTIQKGTSNTKGFSRPKRPDQTNKRSACQRAQTQSKKALQTSRASLAHPDRTRQDKHLSTCQNTIQKGSPHTTEYYLSHFQKQKTRQSISKPRGPHFLESRPALKTGF